MRGYSINEHICNYCRRQKKCKGNGYDLIRGNIIGYKDFWRKDWVGVVLAPPFFTFSATNLLIWEVTKMSCSLRKWFNDLPWMQQGVLMSAFRNVDGVHQDGPHKILTRGIRAACIKSARTKGSFNARRPDSKMLLDAAKDFINFGDELPLHFVTHLMHAAEVIAYSHPDEEVATLWRHIYYSIVESIHFNPESREEFSIRLMDDLMQVQREEAWDDACYKTNKYGDNTGTVNERQR